MDKLDEYRRLGITYWIVDYLAIGKRAKHLENDISVTINKLSAKCFASTSNPTIFVYRLVDREYRVQRFTGSDRIISVTFPELILTAEQVFAASQVKKL